MLQIPASKQKAILREAVRERCARSLSYFIEKAWAVLEPGTPYVHNWHIDMIAEHLEAITNGVNIEGRPYNRLLINVPPGTMKSLLVNVFWPAWEWGPKGMPHMSYLCAAHKVENLSARDSRKMRLLVTSDWYQSHWGDTVQLTRDQNEKLNFQNTALGQRTATAISSLTGIRADRVIIDDPHSVDSASSETQRQSEVETFLEAVPTRLNDPIKAAIIVIMQRLHEEDVSGVILDRQLGYDHICYDDQTEILTHEGWVPLPELKDGVAVLGVSPDGLRAQWEVPTQYVRYFYDGPIIHYKSMTADLMVTPDHRMVYCDPNEMKGGRAAKWRVRPASAMPKEFYLPQVVEWQGYSGPVLFGGKQWQPQAFAEFMGWYLSEGCASVERCTTRIIQNADSKHVAEIERMLDATPFEWKRYRHTGKSDCWTIWSKDLAAGLAPLGSSLNKRAPDVLKNLQPQFLQQFLIAYAKGDGHFAVRNQLKITIGTASKQMADDLHECAVKAGWAASLNCRFQKGGDIFNGYVRPDSTIYKLYIRASKTEGVERKIASRIRPAHTSSVPYSGMVYCVSVPSSAVVVRRNGRVSVSGNCLPMRFDPSRALPTMLGAMDPREDEGELLFPDRFPEHVVKRDEAVMGPYACNPAEAPVLMSDLSMKPIGEVQVGDELIGFGQRERSDGKEGRMTLMHATVLQVHKRKAPVVKMTLDSGEVIRCTPDHRWFKKVRQDRDWYGPAEVGSKLARVCPPRLPTLSAADERLAGWLSGFFDGEGTVTNCEKRFMDGDFRPSSRIIFYQGAGRNLPLCEKLEYALKHFGFSYTYSEDERKPNKDAPCYGYRSYGLTGMSLPMMQRFLHIVQPTKWRDRIIKAPIGARFIQGRERVVSIEPDGEEDVFALTTTTGNYIVWGLMSSNCAGQFQQEPIPRGGGIIKREWWQLWDDERYPPLDYVIASLDTAYTTKQENDMSAMTVWGVFSQDPVASANGTERVYKTPHPKVIMLYAWAERLEIHDLIAKVAETAKRFHVDKLLIENKAAGISVSQELRRLYANADFAVQLMDTGAQDKVARAYAVQHLFSEGLIYAPDKTWADIVLNQCANFPKGKHDDLVDTVTQALRYLRTTGLLQRVAEVQEEIGRSMIHNGAGPQPLYPV